MGRDARIAMVRLGAEDAGLNKGLRNAEKQVQSWAHRVQGRLSSAFRAGFGGLGGVAGLAGIAGFGAMAREVKQFDDRLVRLGISAGKSRTEMLAFNGALQKVAQETGVSADDLLAGAEKYQELTGRFGEFEGQLENFAKVQAATGASMSDIATAAAALSDNLGVAPEKFLETFDILSEQGKKGAVEIRNLAGELAGLTGQFALFGTKGVTGAAQLGAWLQVLRKGAPNATEAATQLEALMGAIRMQHRELAKLGINVWADEAKTQLRDLSEIAQEVIAKVPVSKWGEVFGRKEAQNALITFRNNREEFEKLRASAGAAGGIMRDFGKYSESAGAKMARAEAKFKAVINKALIENLDQLVAAFQALVDALVMLARPEVLAGLAALKVGNMLSGVGGGRAGIAGAAAGMVGGTAGAGGGFLSAAASALTKFTTAVGLASIAAGAIAAAFDAASAKIDEQEKQRAARTLDVYASERAADLGIGAGGLDMAPRVGGKVNKKQREGAQYWLGEAARQGFLKNVGGAMVMDLAAGDKFIESQPGLDADSKKRFKAAIRASHRLMMLDPEIRAFVDNQMGQGTPGAPQVFGQGNLTPGWQGGTWEEQLAAGADAAAAQTPGTPREIRVRIVPTEGFSAYVENDPNNRRGR